MNRNSLIVTLIFISGLIASCTQQQPKETTAETTQPKDTTPTLLYDGEKHLSNMRQLTFSGDNAEAYFSNDGKKIVFQARNKAEGRYCDQIYWSSLDNFNPVRLSNGTGRTTCAYFLPGDTLILYASTHLADTSCVPDAPRKKGDPYIWRIYSSFDIFISDLKGNIVKRLTNTPGYDAEATVSPKGDKIVFTSVRSGDLELYTMNIDGTGVKQITHELGYDGGAFFTPDGKQLIFRASRPKTKEDIKIYRQLLKEEKVMPTHMELFICNADGSNLKQLTSLGNANWAPFMHADGKKIIFSSNHTAEHGIPFNLYTINPDGSGLEQITYDSFFDAFPVFSPDGKKLIFSSGRHAKNPHDTNLFIADWND
jgi:TolB protein